MQHWMRRAWRAARITGVFLVALPLLAAVVGMAAPAPARPAGDDPVRDSALALLPQFLGLSGKLRMLALTPERLQRMPVLGRLVPAEVSETPGVHDLGLSAPDGEPVRVVSLIPFTEKRGSRLEGYHLGFWPAERRRTTRYEPPAGFIEVTPENEDTPVSARFRFSDFLTHDQHGVWPKLLVLEPRLLDKLELLADRLQELGLPSHLVVMSGFRSPQYNAKGVGRRGGRARDSRHMYGDAADVFVDGDLDGRMDDLNGDGKVDVQDARYLRSVAEQVEDAHPELIGGIGVYRASRTHGPFVHVDTRGFPARW